MKMHLQMNHFDIYISANQFKLISAIHIFQFDKCFLSFINIFITFYVYYVDRLLFFYLKAYHKRFVFFFVAFAFAFTE